jgi:phage gpG-like protein
MAFQLLTEMKQRMEDGGARKRLMFALVSEVIAPSVKTNIKVGGRPPFAPLSPFTLHMKQLKGQPLQPGIATGVMYASLTPGAPYNVTKVTEDGIEFGTDAPGAFTFHYGLKRNHQPPRPFLMVQPEDVTDMADRYKTWLITGVA